MGKASSSKKVARAARTGGGRTRRGSSSWVWPTVIVLVVVVGTGLIVLSKSEQTAEAGPPKRGDHWHAALGINICGEFLPPISDQNDPAGIHTHGEGVVHIHPNSETAVGERATLGKYFEAVKAKVSASEIRLPGQEAKKEGERCGDKPAEIRTRIWSSRAPDAEVRTVTGNPSSIRFTNDGELITVALLPAGDDIPKPPSADQLDKLTDVPNQTSVPPSPTETTAPAATSETTVPPAPTETTVAPPAETSPPTTAAP